MVTKFQLKLEVVCRVCGKVKRGNAFTLICDECSSKK